MGARPRPPEVPCVRSPAPLQDVVGIRRVARSGGPENLIRPVSRRTFLAAGAALGAALTGCGRPTASPAGSAPLRIGAIPDQDPEVLQRLYGTVAEAVSAGLDLAVGYAPVTDYAAAVSLFRTGDLDLVWFGGLTGETAAA